MQTCDDFLDNEIYQILGICLLGQGIKLPVYFVNFYILFKAKLQGQGQGKFQ